MNKQQEALKLALEAMTYADACLKKQLTTKDKHQYAQDLLLEAGTAIREALAEQPKESPKFDPNESFEREEAAVARVREFMSNH